MAHPCVSQHVAILPHKDTDLQEKDSINLPSVLWSPPFQDGYNAVFP